MPELPEVETIVRDIAPHLTGRTLRRPTLYRSDVLRRVSPRRLLRTLDRNVVREVARRAKHVVLVLASGHRLVIQPRMTGALVIVRRRLRAEERRYAVFRASIGQGTALVYRDIRRLGTFELLDEPGWQSYTARIGPEPLADAFDVVAFRACLHGSRQAIKKVLMDQRRLAGVGNIYANEALFRAGVDPSRPAGRLDAASIARLHGAIRQVLTEALDARGTTVRDYRTGTGERGTFQFALHVYGRGGAPCERCATPLVTTHAIDGRQTTFCWRCQGGA